VQPAASIQFGLPRPIQTIFLVETAMNNILQVAEDRVRRIVAVMDGIEEQLIDAQPRLAATQLDELHLREDEPDKLEKEYVRWGCRLADVLGVPIYPYSQRYRNNMGTVAGNVSVRG
jgi:hypothetical protein